MARESRQRTGTVPRSRTHAIPPPHGRPFPDVPRLRPRVLFALAISFLMIGSAGAYVLGGALGGHPAGRRRRPSFRAGSSTGVQSGAQLTPARRPPQPGLRAPDPLRTPTTSAPSLRTHPDDASPSASRCGTRELLARSSRASPAPSSPMFHQWLTLDQERRCSGRARPPYQNTINYFTVPRIQGPDRGAPLGLLLGDRRPGRERVQHPDRQRGLRLQRLVAAIERRPALAPDADRLRRSPRIDGLDMAQVAHTRRRSVNPDGASRTSPAAARESASAPLVPLGARRSAARAHRQPQQRSSTSRTTASSGSTTTRTHHRVYRTYQVITPGPSELRLQRDAPDQPGDQRRLDRHPDHDRDHHGRRDQPDDIEGCGQLVWNNPNQIMDRLVAACPVDASVHD